MGTSLVSILGTGCLLTAVFAAPPQANDLSAVQTYRFGDWVMTVTPWSADSTNVVANPAADIVIQPAVFAEESSVPLDVPNDVAVSPPLPLDDASLPPAAAEPVPCTASLSPAVAHAGRYAEIYASIPFSRTEYDINPSYRHDATMELLLGQPRPRPPVQQTSVNVDVSSGGGWGWPYYRTPYGYGWPRFHSNFYPSGISGTRVFVSE
ncbi:hypothetical protein GC163_13585 [bacterium]|nr:hypothetical protein [bacterium]